MKSLITLSLLLLSINYTLASDESCQSFLGLKRAKTLSQLCLKAGIKTCTVKMSCNELITNHCEANSYDEQETFACKTNLYFDHVKGQTAYEVCTDFGNGDEQAYFACRTNLYAGYDIY